MSETVVCRTCKEELPATVEYYQVKRSNISGLNSECRKCRNLHGRTVYQSPEQKAKHKIRAAEWYAANKEEVKRVNKKWRDENKHLRKQQARLYYEKTKDAQKQKNRKNDLLREYGITPEIFSCMFTKQNGLCGICSRPMDGTSQQKLPNVDHCHKTGGVRALLCGRCNAALGLFYDSAEMLRKAAEYLDWHNGHA